MSERARGAEIEEDVLQLFQLKQKMGDYKKALFKADQAKRPELEKALFRLDHEYGITRQRLFYGRSKEDAQELLALLKNKQEEYGQRYGDAFDDLLVQVMDYIAGYGGAVRDSSLDSASEEITLEDEDI